VTRQIDMQHGDWRRQGRDVLAGQFGVHATNPRTGVIWPTVRWDGDTLRWQEWRP